MTLTRYESLEIMVERKKKACKEKTNKCKCVNLFSFLAKLSKNNENFSVQRLHYYWKVLAGRVGKYTVENDFSESQCSQ